MPFHPLSLWVQHLSLGSSVASGHQCRAAARDRERPGTACSRRVPGTAWGGKARQDQPVPGSLGGARAGRAVHCSPSAPREQYASLTRASSAMASLYSGLSSLLPPRAGHAGSPAPEPRGQSGSRLSRSSVSRTWQSRWRQGWQSRAPHRFF